MITITKEYMEQPKDIRQSHLNLKDKCIERIFETQYRQSGYSYYLKGLLAHVLDTNIPLRNKDGVNVLLAHACNNAKCANPKHLYWATSKENIADSGSYYERNLKKNGKQFIIDTARKVAKEKPPGYFSKINNRKGKKHTLEHRKNISLAITKWHKNG
jgi:hypothetical protein|tara:strand:- start:155 stop:628 length:474 start_codon:yes stop_codon:yes gene_type:complete